MLHRLRPAILCLALLCVLPSFAQKKFLRHFSIASTASTSPLPPSNSISQIKIQDSFIWIGTSRGLAKSGNGGRSWDAYKSDPAFVTNGIFAVDVSSDTVWSATGYDKEITDGTVQTGSGYARSTDAGTTWSHFNQTLDQRGDSILSYGINDSLWVLPVTVPEQNVTFDISLSPGAVWIASWASGLRKSTNQGQKWERTALPPDNQNTINPTDTLWTYGPSDSLHLHRIYPRFDPRRNNNFLAFSVHTIGKDTIWCGTAGGVNRSTDGGSSWVKFNHRNQPAGILGNWVIAINHQQYHGKLRIWTTNWTTTDPDEEYGVSYTDDGGRTWTNLLHGVKAYDFAFKDSIVYIATDDGVYRSDDGGAAFVRFSNMTDPADRQIIASSQVFSVGVVQDTVFVGTGDGLAGTIDNGSNPFGSSWKILRSFQSISKAGQSYAYPNPFSANFGPVRIHFLVDSQTGVSSTPPSVTIDLFDYGMNRVRSLIHDAPREPNKEFDELWDGRNDDGRVVANGVYFYRITISGGDEASFGKILVIQ